MMKITDENKNNWYVYRHIRLDKNMPFYIGIGKHFCHYKPKYLITDDSIYYRAYEKDPKKRNNIWKSIVNKSDWKADIMMDNMSANEVKDKEIELIKFYGRIDNNSGCLSNMTDGGDGIWGYKASEETKLRLSLSKRGERNPHFGKRQSNKTKDKRSKKMIMIWNDKSLKEKEEWSNKMRNRESSKKQSKPVLVYDYNTGLFINEFDSIRRASMILGVSDNKIVSVCKGRRRRVSNYVFIYKKPDAIVLSKIEINKNKKPRSQESKDKMAIISSKPVSQFDRNGLFIRKWNNIKSASEFLKTTACHISAVCKGKRPSAGGFIWKYD